MTNVTGREVLSLPSQAKPQQMHHTGYTVLCTNHIHDVTWLNLVFGFTLKLILYHVFN